MKNPDYQNSIFGSNFFAIIMDVFLWISPYTVSLYINGKLLDSLVRVDLHASKKLFMQTDLYANLYRV